MKEFDSKTITDIRGWLIEYMVHLNIEAEKYKGMIYGKNVAKKSKKIKDSLNKQFE